MNVNSNCNLLLLNSLNANEEQQQTDMLELSSGKSVNTPSDNPAAAALETQNLASIADAAQYQQNISSTQSMMQSAQSALGSVVTSLNSVITQGVEAANGTISAAERTQMASTVSAALNQVIGLANTSVQGVYLFGGTASNTPPFQLNADPTTGVTYNGNSGVNTVPVGDGQTVQSNVPGDQIFAASGGNVMQSLTDMINALQSNSTAGIESATTEVTNALGTVSQQQAFYSNANTALDATNTYLQSDTVTLQTQQNNLVGANLTAVASNLTQEQTTEQATLEAMAKVLPMSLLNYLPTTT